MKTNKEKVIDFYTAFSKKDHEGMANCYHEEIYFRDEAFELNGKEVQAMWHMLCLRGKDLVIEFGDLVEEGETVTAKWEAKYTFSATKRKVHNKIHAKFKFKEGLIVEHIDSFNFWKWSSQALGLPGYLLGWSFFLKKKVRDQAGNSLNAFISSHSEYQ
ncbi:MAG: nuclear transport factor 2 family protein [Balneolaceae bacterium]